MVIFASLKHLIVLYLENVLYFNFVLVHVNIPKWYEPSEIIIPLFTLEDILLV